MNQLNDLCFIISINMDYQVLSFSEFDISATNAFIPNAIPLSRLPSAYGPWEHALDQVNCGLDSVLALGEDTSPEALAKRESSERWRQSIRDVNIFPFLSKTCTDPPQ